MSLKDNEINNIIQCIMSSDLSNVLLGIKLYQQQQHFDRLSIAEEFLSLWSGYCINMYVNGNTSSSRFTKGVFEARAVDLDPFPHTTIGLAFEDH